MKTENGYSTHLLKRQSARSLSAMLLLAGCLIGNAKPAEGQDRNGLSAIDEALAFMEAVSAQQHGPIKIVGSYKGIMHNVDDLLSGLPERRDNDSLSMKIDQVNTEFVEVRLGEKWFHRQQQAYTFDNNSMAMFIAMIADRQGATPRGFGKSSVEWHGDSSGQVVLRREGSDPPLTSMSFMLPESETKIRRPSEQLFSPHFATRIRTMLTEMRAGVAIGTLGEFASASQSTTIKVDRFCGRKFTLEYELLPVGVWVVGHYREYRPEGDLSREFTSTIDGVGLEGIETTYLEPRIAPDGKRENRPAYETVWKIESIELFLSEVESQSLRMPTPADATNGTHVYVEKDSLMYIHGDPASIHMQPERQATGS